MPDSVLIVDGHTHLYRQSAVAAALDAASRNFAAELAAQGHGAGYGLLLLADPPGVPGFEWLCDYCSKSSSGGWQTVSRPDESVIHVTRADALPLAVVSGNQLISRENLELLVFPRPAHDLAAAPLADLVGQAGDAGRHAILPWGVGKWLGGRARIVRDVLDGGDRDLLSVGDNGGRPSWWRRVRLLEQAGRLGYRDIPGSDPLPVANEELRIGSYGATTHATVDPGWTTADFIGLLSHAPLIRYGRRLGLARFVSCQYALRRRPVP